MPETADAFGSVGYLIAAAAITIVGLAGYSVLLAQRLSQARARSTQLRRDAQARATSPGSP